MAQFDVYRIADGGFVVDCQAEPFADIPTRLCVPLIPQSEAHAPHPRLNPVFEIQGEPMVLLTQFASAIRVRELRSTGTSLERERYAIIDAIDLLLTGI